MCKHISAEVLRERARNNIWKHWQKLQEKYDRLSMLRKPLVSVMR